MLVNSSHMCISTTIPFTLGIVSSDFGIVLLALTTVTSDIKNMLCVIECRAVHIASWTTINNFSDEILLTAVTNVVVG